MLKEAKPIFLVIGLFCVLLEAFHVGNKYVSFGWLGVFILGIGFWLL